MHANISARVTKPLMIKTTYLYHKGSCMFKLSHCHLSQHRQKQRIIRLHLHTAQRSQTTFLNDTHMFHVYILPSLFLITNTSFLACKQNCKSVCMSLIPSFTVFKDLGLFHRNSKTELWLPLLANLWLF